jgi:two-component system chemotaxis sensor kinase CheA
MIPLDAPDLRAKFALEARERLKQLTSAFLRIEQTPEDGETIAEALRQVHSLKGSALMLQLKDIAQVAHSLEDLFVAAQVDAAILRPSTFDAALGALDVLALRVEQVERGASIPAAVEHLCEALASLAAGPAGTDAGPADANRTAARPQAPAAAASLRGAPAPSLRVPTEKLDALSGLAAELVLHELKVSERLGDLRRLEAALRQVKAAMSDTRSGVHEDGTHPFAEPLDAFATLLRGMRQLVNRYDDDHVRLKLMTGDVRQHVMALTLVPISTVFEAFPRAVRDLARAFKTEVNLSITGGDTEIDKKIIDQIADPLIHLLRNAMDHGIEPARERVALGKAPAAKLRISAEHRGNRIVITIEDDGRGIDPATIRASAVRLGIARAEELEEWSEQEIMDLIFRPGFSTRASVTDVSGRGVGMDVVRRVLTRLDGTVRVQSRPGHGTAIVLDLPLSLALLRVVLVRAGGELFAIPTSAVRRIVHLHDGDVVQSADGKAADVAGLRIPLVPLASLLGMRPSASASLVVIVAVGGLSLGLVVRVVEEEQEIVFHELRGVMAHQPFFSGASILPNGEIVPVLDMQALLQIETHGMRIPVSGVPQILQSGRVLVVEDSPVAGELLRTILAGSGYEVELAGNGMEALGGLGRTLCDLVIADVDMPHLNGFDFTRRLRADVRYQNVPVIIVTSHDSVEDRQRGFDAGASAFIVKREFDQEQFLATVRRLIARPGETESPPKH